MDAFTNAGTPGRGSTVGDFVPGKNGGWVPKNHPDALGGARVDGGPDVGVGEEPGAGLSPEAGPSGPAMAGLSSAAGGNSGSAVGVREMAPPSASNPQLGQRIYPVAMRQLALLPRAY